MALKRALRSGVAAACIVSVAVPAGAAAPVARALAQSAGPEVRVASAATFSRLEIRGARARAARDGQTLTLTFNRDGDPDISRLRTNPPKWIKSAEKRRSNGRLQLVLTLADDADAKVGEADGATYVNVYAKPEPEPETAEAAADVPVAEAEPARPNPMPASGVVRMESRLSGGQVLLSFTWANPAGAAIFRRGDAVWVVFDAPATLDVSKAPRGQGAIRSLEARRGADYAAVRIETGAETPVYASSVGATWTIALGAGAQPAPTVVRVARDAAGGPPTLQAAVAGATRVINLPDPAVGDVLKIVTALGPPKGAPSAVDFVDIRVLPSIQGLAIQPNSDDVEVSHDDDIVHIARGDRMILSPVSASQKREKAQLGAPQPAAMPGLIRADWGQTGEDGFQARYEHLLAAASAETVNRDPGAPVAARMALARFLIGSELSFEAIGVLNSLARMSPRVLDDAEFRGLRGIARTLARRYAEADTDFASPAIADDASAALWRAYLDVQSGQYQEARNEFTSGASAFGLLPAVWKTRIARADAEAAIALGDLSGAEMRVRQALAEKVSSEEQLRTRLVQAKLFELKGDRDRALRVYAAAATAPIDSISAPATLRATQIRLESGQIAPNQAANVYDSLRFRWRGDSTELETIRALGQLYLTQGRYREALEALRSAGVRLPSLPEAQKLQTDLNTAFRALFLDGLADGLEPVQALALFFDFKELAPIGADGDLMVRKIVKRLVDVDMLSQAADLLKYQAENRLDGVPRAQVATDLATIYLMDRRPEQALEAINNSRTTVLPAALNAERRLVEARAWAALGRYENALEIIERDTSRDAQDLRSEVSWKQKNWAAAAPLFEKALGDRWKNPSPLSSEEEGRLLRAGVAYSLAGDDAALTRLNARYGGFLEKANNPDALRIALTGETDGRISSADFGRVTADNEAFAGWVGKMKARFKTRPAPVGTGKAPAVKQAQAAPKAAPKG